MALCCAVLCGALVTDSVRAQAFDPVVELFRLGGNDRLVVNRGGPVDSAGDVNGDGAVDLLVGAGTGGVRVIFGPTGGDAGRLDVGRLDGANGFTIVADLENDSVFAGIGDINDDGIDDIAVGSLAGTYVIFGRNGAFPRTVEAAELDGDDGFRFDSPASQVAAAGDIDGDGIVDLLVGNANASPNLQDGAGIAYVVYGRHGTFEATLSPAGLDGGNGFAILGAAAGDRAASAVAGAGDVNGDGVDDLLIGAPYRTVDGRAERGSAWLVFGAEAGFPTTVSLADIDGGNGFAFVGSDIQDIAGASLAGIGDLNHDGLDDVAIGAPGKGPFGSPSDYPGEIYVIYGSATARPATIVEDDLDGGAGFVIRGIRGGVVPIEANQAIWGDQAGQSVDAAGDFNADGVDDLVIGASHSILTPARKGNGQVYVVYGSPSAFPARFDLANLDGANGFRIDGEGTVDYFGFSVSGAGDFNGDALQDIVAGASGQAESFLIYGRPTGNARAPAPGRQTNGTISSGFAAAALNARGTDAEPLIFNELADPTGPNPLPPGTSTVLGSSDTPGNIPPYVNTSPPPGEAVDPEPGSPSGPTEPTEPSTPTEPSAPVESPDQAGEPATPDGGPEDEARVRVGGGGAAGWWLMGLLGGGLCLRGVRPRRARDPAHHDRRTRSA